MTFECINADQAMTLIRDENAVVIDIRDPQSFSAGHIDGAVHVDNATVESFIGQADPALPLIVCCYHGNMSKGAADYFSSQGFSRSYSLDGGYSAWPHKAPEYSGG